MNTTTVTFFVRETSCYAQPLWQWDYGQVLVIKGVTLPESFEVHWTDKTSGTTTTTLGQTVDGVSSVEVPDVYLESGNNIFAYVYLHETESDGETEYKVTIPVLPRPKPVHETPTPVQQTEIEQLIARLETAVESAEAAAAEAEEAAEKTRQNVVVETFVPHITFGQKDAYDRVTDSIAAGGLPICLFQTGRISGANNYYLPYAYKFKHNVSYPDFPNPWSGTRTEYHFIGTDYHAMLCAEPGHEEHDYFWELVT